MGDPIPLLKDLIRIDSSTKAGVNKAMAFCEEWLNDKGLPVERLVNNGYSMLVSSIGSGSNTIVLNGHIDVIEGSRSQFTPYTKEGKIYGRGSADMKAGLAAMMETMAELNGVPLPWRVQLQIVPDEETGGLYGTNYLVEQGHRGDFIICGEPTNMGIAIQSKGVLQVDIHIKGEPAHGSRPWEGNNAILKAHALYEAILELPFAQEVAPPMFKEPSINLAKLQGGTVYNKVPDRCDMSLDIRYLPDQSPSEILRQIKGITDGVVRTHICNSPVKTKADNPFVQALADSLVAQTQLEKATLYGQHGSNDGQFFTKYGGNAVEFGPVGYDWHGDNEMVYTDSVRQYQAVLIDFLKNGQSDFV